MFMAYGDYSVTAVETNWMENAQFINFITKFSNFHTVSSTDDGHMGHQYICSDFSEENTASVFKVTEH
jgi:hypothetical protein